MSGYVTIPRSIEDEAIFKDHERFWQLQWLVMHASYKPETLIVQGKETLLRAGQLVASYRFLQQAWTPGGDGMSHSPPSIKSIRHTLKTLEALGYIKTEISQGRVTVITVCNYERYHANIPTSGNSAEHSAGNSTDNSEGHKTNKYKQVNNDKNYGNTKRKSSAKERLGRTYTTAERGTDYAQSFSSAMDG